ncbi:hypothetical protein AB0K60_09710 [Thermopolyspora sp. NPDC052614]|uniref:hypothetical protein n=1 Tax=Thermopolyspora sp. NPDC052614 TaxID=3155682 RepID=UPI0034387393
MTQQTAIAEVTRVIDGLYATPSERVTRNDIHAHAVAADLAPDLMVHFDHLPEGDYERDELIETLNQMIRDRGEEKTLGLIPEF